MADAHSDGGADLQGPAPDPEHNRRNELQSEWIRAVLRRRAEHESRVEEARRRGSSEQTRTGEPPAAAEPAGEPSENDRGASSRLADGRLHEGSIL